MSPTEVIAAHNARLLAQAHAKVLACEKELERLPTSTARFDLRYAQAYVRRLENEPELEMQRAQAEAAIRRIVGDARIDVSIRWTGKEFGVVADVPAKFMYACNIPGVQITSTTHNIGDLVLERPGERKRWWWFWG